MARAARRRPVCLRGGAARPRRFAYWVGVRGRGCLGWRGVLGCWGRSGVALDRGSGLGGRDNRGRVSGVRTGPDLGDRGLGSRRGERRRAGLGGSRRGSKGVVPRVGGRRGRRDTWRRGACRAPLRRRRWVWSRARVACARRYRAVVGHRLRVGGRLGRGFSGLGGHGGGGRSVGGRLDDGLHRGLDSVRARTWRHPGGLIVGHRVSSTGLGRAAQRGSNAQLSPSRVTVSTCQVVGAGP